MAFKFVSEVTLEKLIAKIQTSLSGKVDAVSGKGLSTNDYTTVEKTKLNGVAEGAQVNVIEEVQANGTKLSVANKVVNIPLANASRAGLMSAADYTAVTNIDNTVSEAVAEALKDVTGISYEIKTSLPSTGEAGVIYLVSNNATNGDNVYDEFIWTGTSFERIGSTECDLSGYAKTADFVEITEAEMLAYWK